MAKREIYKLKILETDHGVCPYYEHITEEEIVKPYLEKLKTEIAGLKRFELRGAVTPLVNANRVIELIDNLLTERGAEE